MTTSEINEKLNITVDFIAQGASNRPGTKITPTHVTIHNTANAAAGADALMHARYVKGADARARQVSWHFTVDDVRCVKHLPTTEKGFHAKAGNSKSIGIEVCEFAGMSKAAAIDRAALLTAVLAANFGLSVDRVVPHKFWTGKDCPHVILREPGGFDAFRAKVSAFLDEMAQESVAGPLSFEGVVDQEDDSEESVRTTSLDALDESKRVATLERLVGRLAAENEMLKELARGALEDERDDFHESASSN